ncbi:hypothetical protein STA3757_46690 [Stanieria sp. NIES-3757]|nr:hypothetical protein STA3757_46690 [Stanieria sp. NIES-3757]
MLIIVGSFLITPTITTNYVFAQCLETLPNQEKESNILIKDELYFGLEMPRGERISEPEWELFVKRVLTPRFKEGLTILDAYGQYLNSSGILIKEKSKLVILIYENNLIKNKQVEEAIALYKKTFQQESVLRVTSFVRVSF